MDADETSTTRPDNRAENIPAPAGQVRQASEDDVPPVIRSHRTMPPMPDPADEEAMKRWRWHCYCLRTFFGSGN